MFVDPDRAERARAWIEGHPLSPRVGPQRTVVLPKQPLE